MDQDAGDLCGSSLYLFSIGNHCCTDWKCLHSQGEFPLFLCNWLTWEFESCLGSRSSEQGELEEQKINSIGVRHKYTSSQNQICWLHATSISPWGVDLPLGLETHQLQWLDLLLDCALLGTDNKRSYLICPYFDWHIHSFFECVNVSIWL